MNGENNTSRDAKRLEAAALWLTRSQTGELDESGWLEFERWLSDPANRAALAAIEAPLADIDDHPDYVAAAVRRAKPASQGNAGPMRGWLAAAAGLILCAGIIGFVFSSQKPAPPTTVMAYSAPPDSALPVTLPDGSSAVLNRGAAIEVHWSSAERRVTLGRGEAAFKVHHDPSHPMIVTVGDNDIRDLGTEFNIRKEQDGFVLTVREGSVGVDASAKSPVVISAGQALTVNHSAATATVSSVEANDAFSWREGQLIYHDATLTTVVADLNRYATIPVRIAEGPAGALRFSGVLVIGPIDRMASQLQAFLPIRVDQEAGAMVLSPR